MDEEGTPWEASTSQYQTSERKGTTRIWSVHSSRTQLHPGNDEDERARPQIFRFLCLALGLGLFSLLMYVIFVPLIVGEASVAWREFEDGWRETQILHSSVEERLRELPMAREKRGAQSAEKPQNGHGKLCPEPSTSTECPPGKPGAKGVTGSDGEPGIDGKPGRAGENALDAVEQTPTAACAHCPPGNEGKSGPAGKPGVRGMRGPTGQPGAPGTNGIHGAPGEQGTPGEQGPTGATGVTGAPGGDGVKMLNVKGAKGSAGQAGMPGPRGIKGTDSRVVGTRGVRGPDGLVGDEGQKGSNGQPGPPGPQGPPGTQPECCSKTAESQLALPVLDERENAELLKKFNALHPHEIRRAPVTFADNNILKGFDSISAVSKRTERKRRPKKRTHSNIDKKKAEIAKFEKSRLLDQTMIFHGPGLTETRNIPTSEKYRSAGIVDLHNVLRNRHMRLEEEEKELRAQKERVEKRLLGQLDQNSIHRMLRAMRRRKLRRRPTSTPAPEVELTTEDYEVTRPAEASAEAHRSSSKSEERQTVEVIPSSVFQSRESLTVDPTPEPAVTITIPTDISLQSFENVQPTLIPNLDEQNGFNQPMVDLAPAPIEAHAYPPAPMPRRIPSEVAPSAPHYEEPHFDEETEEGFFSVPATSPATDAPSTTELPPPQSELYPLASPPAPEYTSPSPPGISIAEQFRLVTPSKLSRTLQELETNPLLPSENDLITVTPEDISRLTDSQNSAVMGSAELIPAGPPTNNELAGTGFGLDGGFGFGGPSEISEGASMLRTTMPPMPTLIPDFEPSRFGHRAFAPGGQHSQIDLADENTALGIEEEWRVRGDSMLNAFSSKSTERPYESQTVTLMVPPTGPPTVQLFEQNAAQQQFDVQTTPQPPMETTFEPSTQYYRRKKNRILENYKKAMRKHRKRRTRPTTAAPTTTTEASEPVYETRGSSTADAMMRAVGSTRDSQRKKKLLKKLHRVEAMLNHELDRYIDQLDHEQGTTTSRSQESQDDDHQRRLSLARSQPTRVMLQQVHKRKRKRLHKAAWQKKRTTAYPTWDQSTSTEVPPSFGIVPEVTGETSSETQRPSSTNFFASEEQADVATSRTSLEAPARARGEINFSPKPGRRRELRRLHKKRRSSAKQWTPEVHEEGASRPRVRGVRRLSKKTRHQVQYPISTRRPPATTTRQTVNATPTLRTTQRVRRFYYRPLSVRRIRLQPVSAYLSSVEKL
ncbi:unnamed protein product, partial [Mesorhabditis spiculigera]